MPPVPAEEEYGESEIEITIGNPSAGPADPNPDDTVTVIQEPVLPESEPTMPEPSPPEHPPLQPVTAVPPSAGTDEYARAIGGIETDEIVTQDTFEKDKKQILQIIEELDEIMRSRNYTEWLKYLTPASRAYWSNSKNLRALSKKLPIKGLSLKNLEDYFKYVFLPSRQGKQIDEIRYISSTIVKAVQINGNKDIIFYYFQKINDRWLLNLEQGH